MQIEVVSSERKLIQDLPYGTVVKFGGNSDVLIMYGDNPSKRAAVSLSNPKINWLYEIGHFEVEVVGTLKVTQ